MINNSLQHAPLRSDIKTRRRKSRVVHRFVERNLIHRISYDKYREKVRKVYGGRRGAMLTKFSSISGHLQFGERLLRKRQFDPSGLRNILDIGSGAGQILGHLLKYADSQAKLTGIDISYKMLDRAQRRLKSTRVRLIAADLAQLPFPNSFFDCVTCGYVLEHLPDAYTGLAEISRVMTPGGRLLLFATEDSFSGAWTSRLWTCRTYNRRDLLGTCEKLGLTLTQELWFTRMHRFFRAGGICVELTKSKSNHFASPPISQCATLDDRSIVE